MNSAIPAEKTRRFRDGNGDGDGDGDGRRATALYAPTPIVYDKFTP
ncbi:hypothetical protein [Lysobacter capsici]|nr:hypothetical protein [Lysobacter capsici]WND82481.1 hypothetical protein RJ610_09080 [Lysobacter capsici]WND87677.1 hypothetical protein RJ609_09085 [Lysobacter capsici]